MPLVRVASVGGDVVVLSVDVDAQGRCVGAVLVNGAGRDVTVTLVRDGEDVASGTFGAGTHTRSLPGGRRFDWASAGVSLGLTVRWP